MRVLAVRHGERGAGPPPMASNNLQRRRNIVRDQNGRMRRAAAAGARPAGARDREPDARDRAGRGHSGASRRAGRPRSAPDDDHGKPVAIPDRDTLHAALLRRVADWRDVLRGPRVQPARVVLQHLMDLPLLVCNRPVPDYILKRLEQAPVGPHWIAAAKPERLTVGLYS